MPAKRRRATREERLMPCECCNFPLSHRHHLLRHADFGENDSVASLCGTCHDIFHVMQSAYIKNSKEGKQLCGNLLLKLGHGDERLIAIYRLVMEADRRRKAFFRWIEKAVELETSQSKKIRK